MKTGTIKILSGIIIMLTALSCNWMKKEGNKVVDKSKSKIKEFWNEAIDEAISSGDSFEKTNFETSFGESENLEILDMEGIRNNRIMGFYEGFVKYSGKKEKIIKYFIDKETIKPDISDNDFEISDTIYIAERIREIESKEPELNKEIEFFKNYRNLSTSSVYTINKFPLTHTIIFDDRSNIVYHYYENYSD